MRQETVNQIEEMKKQTIGVEIEFTGMTREKAARVVAEHFGTTPQYYGGTYRAWHIYDQQGRKWIVEYDSSIIVRGGEQCELVTPVLKYEDIETLQEVARKLRKAGAKSRPSLSCGVHIHVGADGHDATTLRNLTNIMASHEDILAAAIGISQDRRDRWCKVTSERFLREVNEKKPKTMNELERIWYNGRSQRDMHYSKSRYHMLNLHATFSKGTVEFRCFNFAEPTEERRGGIHAGMLKAYIQLCLAMSQMAKTAKRVSPTPVQQENQKYSLRIWLLRLGFIGEEFATARTVLMRNLTGDCAFRHTSRPKKEKKQSQDQDIA